MNAGARQDMHGGSTERSAEGTCWAELCGVLRVPEPSRKESAAEPGREDPASSCLSGAFY